MKIAVAINYIVNYNIICGTIYNNVLWSYLMNFKTTLVPCLLSSTLMLSSPRIEAAVVVPPGPCSKIQSAINALPAYQLVVIKN